MLSMEWIYQEDITEEKITYKYYPEGKEKFGIVSLVRKNGERVIDKLCESDKFKTYAFHALRLLEKYHEKDEFPEKDLIIW